MMLFGPLSPFEEGGHAGIPSVPNRDDSVNRRPSKDSIQAARQNLQTHL